MGISICIASGKGGAGKTVLTSNLGVALSEFGKDVMLLDADIEMANLALHMGLEGIETTLNNALAGELPVSETIYEGPSGVKVVPAGLSLESLSKVDPDRLEGVLTELLKDTEILMIDAPAGLGKNVVVALSSTQMAILITTPDLPSISGALKTKIIASRMGTHILGVVVNRATFDKGDLTVEEMEVLLETNIIALIPEDPEIRSSAALGQPVVVRVPSSPAAVAIKKLAADLVGEEYAPEVPAGSFIERITKGVFRGS